MSDRDGYEPGVPCWVTAVAPDAEAAAEFYAGLFGWETENLMPADHPGKYIVCRLRGREVAAVVSPHGAPAPPQAVWTTHVWVDSAEATAARAVEAGGSVIGEPFDSPGGGRQAILADPQGAVFCAWEPAGRNGAQAVNEPGAWAMSALTTEQHDRMAAFYAELFGWQAEEMPGTGGEIRLLRLPGFVGGEPQQPVPRDVVAVLVPTGAEGAPRWSVDFWVSDTDAAAERAAELGGATVVGPYDVPGFRQAVLADPQGATFTVSQLMLAGGV
jgi:predicted enzyme related to lactoylglutathione lyase